MTSHRPKMRQIVHGSCYSQLLPSTLTTWLMLTVLMLIHERSSGIPLKELQIRSISQCYGKQVTLGCPPNHVIRVLTAAYLQSAECVSSTETFSMATAAATTLFRTISPPGGSAECSREVPGNPTCVGSRSCSFVASWVQISVECGNSNQLQMKYQCIPDRQLVPICTVPAITGLTSGFVTSPNYPARYTGSQNCSVTLVGPSTAQIKIYSIDISLAVNSRKNINERRCLDKLWITDGFSQTKQLCTMERRELLFTSSSNQATVHFSSSGHDALPAKGFWIYYDVFQPAITRSSALPLGTISSYSSTIPDPSAVSLLPVATGNQPQSQHVTSGTQEVMHHIITRENQLLPASWSELAEILKPEMFASVENGVSGTRGINVSSDTASANMVLDLMPSTEQTSTSQQHQQLADFDADLASTTFTDGLGRPTTSHVEQFPAGSLPDMPNLLNSREMAEIVAMAANQSFAIADSPGHQPAEALTTSSNQQRTNVVSSSRFTPEIEIPPGPSAVKAKEVSAAYAPVHNVTSGHQPFQTVSTSKSTTSASTARLVTALPPLAPDAPAIFASDPTDSSESILDLAVNASDYYMPDQQTLYQNPPPQPPLPPTHQEVIPQQMETLIELSEPEMPFERSGPALTTEIVTPVKTSNGGGVKKVDQQVKTETVSQPSAGLQHERLKSADQTTSIDGASTLGQHSDVTPNTDYLNNEFGVPEIGALTGGAGCFVLLLMVAPVAVYLHARKRRYLRTKRFMTRNNSYNNIIMAFGSDDDTTLSASGISRSSSSGHTDLRYHTSSGSISPSTSSASSSADETPANNTAGRVERRESYTAERSPADGVWVTGGSATSPECQAQTAAGPSGGHIPPSRWLTMPPIDERVEDLYAAFKQDCNGQNRGTKGQTKPSKEKPSRSKSFEHLLMRKRSSPSGTSERAPTTKSTDCVVNPATAAAAAAATAALKTTSQMLAAADSNVKNQPFSSVDTSGSNGMSNADSGRRPHRTVAFALDDDDFGGGSSARGQRGRRQEEMCGVSRDSFDSIDLSNNGDYGDTSVNAATLRHHGKNEIDNEKMTTNSYQQIANNNNSGSKLKAAVNRGSGSRLHQQPSASSSHYLNVASSAADWPFAASSYQIPAAVQQQPAAGRMDYMTSTTGSCITSADSTMMPQSSSRRKYTAFQSEPENFSRLHQPSKSQHNHHQKEPRSKKTQHHHHHHHNGQQLQQQGNDELIVDTPYEVNLLGDNDDGVFEEADVAL